MEKRFACYEDNEVYTLATILDPRYRAWFFRKVSTVENTLQLLKDKLYEEVSQPFEDINSSSSSSNSDTSDAFAAKMKAMIKKNKTESGPDGKDRILKQDIDMAVKDYCKENPSDNAFKYWKDHASSSNPIKRAMAKLAEIYLTPQPTSTDVERLFSTAGDIITNERNRLLPATAENVISRLREHTKSLYGITQCF